MKIKCDVRVSFIQGRDGDYVQLSIEDRASSMQFLEVQMSLAEYGMLCASNCSVKANAEVQGLDRVGKKMLVEQRQMRAPRMPYSQGNQNYINWLDENFKDDGWIRDNYMSSQRSVEYISGTDDVHLNFTVRKWVDAED